MADQSVRLRSLVSSVLALVPAGCQCSAALRQLRRQASGARVRLYLVGSNGDMPQVRRLASLAGQPRGKVANDTSGVLAAKYAPRGLTAVLVGRTGSVGPVLRGLKPPLRLTRQLRLLALSAP